MPSPAARALAALTALVVVALARGAHAEPWFGAQDNAIEDRYLDGDLDDEDVAAMRVGHGHVGASDVHARTWVSLVGFYGEHSGNVHEYGAMAVLGIAFDKIAAGASHPPREPTSYLAEPPAPTPAQAQAPASAPAHPSAPLAPAPVRSPSPIITPLIARTCVKAALRVAGLGVDDARIDEMASRARASAALPETRLRAMRLVTDAAHLTTTTTTTGYYDGAGANLWLEARLTWHLDRLLYADDEPTLERIRLERQDARTRISTHVLEQLFRWQRAWLDTEVAEEGSREKLESKVRMVELELTLDVLTAGWFGGWQRAIAQPPASAPVASRSKQP